MKLVNAEGAYLFAYVFNDLSVKEKMEIPKDKRDRITAFMVANGYRFVFGRWYLQADPISEIKEMCQAFEGESSYVRSSELQKIREQWEKHKSGEAPLTDEQITELAVRKMMLEEA